MSGRAKGIVAIVASAFGFALMALFVRLCDDFGAEIPSFQKSFFRNAIALAIAAFVFVKESRGAEGRPALPATASSWCVLTMRSVFGLIGIFANFYALSKIPIGEAMTLNKTAPFFTVFFSWLLLGERATPRQLAYLCLAFAGAMLVMKPGFRGEETFATVCALVGGLGAGLAYVCVHKLGREKVDGAFIVLFFSAFSCAGSLPFMVFDYHPMTLAQVLILLGAGTGAAIGQFGVTAAYRFAEPRSIALYDYTSIVFTAMFGFAFFGQVPDIASIAGFLVILFAAFRIARRTS